jgi:hypothetical protein
VPVAAAAQVRGHRLGRTPRVAPQHRAEDPLVLRHRGLPGSRRAVEPEHVQVRMQPLDRIGEQGAPGRRGERLVEILVQCRELAVHHVPVTGHRVTAHRLKDGLELVHLLVGRAAGGQGGGVRFEQQAHLEKL